MPKPPLTPEETMRRVTRLARLDGGSVLVIAGGFALLSAMFRDVSGAVVGLMVAAAGAIELHGVTLLRGGARRGMTWLIMSQLYLMAAILAYSGLRILKPDIAWILPYLTGEAAEPLKQAADEMGLTVEQAVVRTFRELYGLVAVITIIYQGGMSIYYLRRRAAVDAAVQEIESQ